MKEYVENIWALDSGGKSVESEVPLPPVDETVKIFEGNFLLFFPCKKYNIGNMKEYGEYMKEYVENMKEYVENMKE